MKPLLSWRFWRDMRDLVRELRTMTPGQRAELADALRRERLGKDSRR
jgi:hypothetical protein